MDEFDEFLTELRRRVAIAEVKHPLFADGIYQGRDVSAPSTESSGMRSPRTRARSASWMKIGTCL